MAVRENNPNCGKLHAARMVNRKNQGRNTDRTVTKIRTNKTKKSRRTMPAIIRQESSAMAMAHWKNENRTLAYNTGLDCFESKS